MRKEDGFSLIEMLIVVAVLGIITAMAIPNFKKARESANSASAVSSVRTLSTAENLYYTTYKEYGTLGDLVPQGALDPNLQTGFKSRYNFLIAVSVDKKSFTCNATPDVSPASLPHYFVDESGVIRFVEGAPADATSPPIPR